MRTEFVKWGNSLALRVPSAFAKEVGATKGKRAEMTIEDGALVIKVVGPKKRRRYTLDELLANFDPDAHRGDVGPAIARRSRNDRFENHGGERWTLRRAMSRQVSLAN